MEKKYEIINEPIRVDGNVLYRIIALKNFDDVKMGDLGGYIQSEYNLSHEGNCWIYDNAKVFGYAQVHGDAKVYGDIIVNGNAVLFGNSKISNNTKKSDPNKKYELTDDTIEVYGRTLHRIIALKNFGNVKINDLGGYIEKETNLSHEGNCWVYDEAKVFGYARIIDNAKVFGKAEVFNNALVCNNTEVYGNAQVHGNAKVSDNAHVFNNAEVYDNAHVATDAEVYGNAQVYGNSMIKYSYICGSASICGHAQIIDNGLITVDNQYITIPVNGSEYITFFINRDGGINVAYKGSSNNIEDFKNIIQSMTMEIFMKNNVNLTIKGE